MKYSRTITLTAALSASLLLSACLPTEDRVEVDINNAEDTRLVYLAFETTEPTVATAIAVIAQDPISNKIDDEGINPGESRRFELGCLFNPHYLNLRWEDGTRRFYRIATPCGKRVRYDVSQDQ